MQFRLPNSLDLAILDPASDGETNRQQLLQRCVITAQRAGQEIATAELPDEVVAAIAQGMAEADPQADVQLALDLSTMSSRVANTAGYCFLFLDGNSSVG